VVLSFSGSIPITIKLVMSLRSFRMSFMKFGIESVSFFNN
jgi:hypothetical protein